MTERLFTGILNVTLTTSALIAMLLLLLPLLNKKHMAAKWRYGIWLALTVRLLIPLSLSYPPTPLSSIRPQLPFAYSTWATEEGIPSGEPANMQTDASEPGFSGSSANNIAAIPARQGTGQADSDKSLPTVNPLILIWLGGMLLSAFYLLWSHALFRRSMFRWCRLISQKRVAEKWENLLLEMGIHRKIRLTICKKVRSPMLTGFIRPVVLLPQEDYDDNTLTFILRHELTHYKRFDLWFKLLLKLAQIVHWFNPLVFLMVRLAEQELEAACDEAVVSGQNMDYRLRYCEAVLSGSNGIKARDTAFSTSFNGGKNFMKKRFRNILSIGKVKGKGVFVACVLALIALTSGTVLAFQSPNNVTEEQNKSIPYILIAENKDWVRPSPKTSGQIEAVRHQLFEMPYGASESVSFYANLGLVKAIIYDPNPDYVRLMIINSQIQSIKVSGDQVIVIADPVSSGYQVISFSRADLSSDNPLINLITANGQTIDSLTLAT